MKLHAIVVGVCCGSAAAQATFTWCGGIPDGQWIFVRGVAEGGAAIAGTANFPAAGGATIGRAFRWTPATGIVNLGTLPSTLTYPYSDAYALSADGNTLTGSSFTTSDRCIRWTPAGGMVEMPILPGWNSAGGTAISADGSVIVGWGGPGVARWDAAGVHSLGAPPWRPYAIAWGASADAGVVTGNAYTSTNVDDRAFVLDAAGWTDLGVLPGDTLSHGRAVSADGTVSVGESRLSTPPFINHPFRWTRAAGTQPLPLAPGATGMSPLAVSGDGSVIVGTQYIQGNPNPDGFVWTPAAGSRSVRAVLQSYGIDLTGTIAVEPQAVTRDGRTLAGVAGGPNQFRAWVATLPVGFGCYANCDSSTFQPALNIADFICFLNRFSAGDTYANCDASTVAPVLNVQDFTCFLNRFAAGCS